MHVLSPAATLASRIAAIMGVEPVTETGKKVARVFARALMRNASPGMFMTDFANVRLRIWCAGGAKSCVYGCLGLGSCVDVCKFDAIHMGPSGCQL